MIFKEASNRYEERSTMKVLYLYKHIHLTLDYEPLTMNH